MLDFSQFKKKFWEKKQNIFKKNPEFPKLNALTVWSEIMSFIKGSPESYSSHDWHLPKEQYLDYVGVHKTSISKEMKEKVWELSIIYEKWKTSKKYFDMMDIVAYLTNQILKVNFLL